jgi:excisionase family DNA binding protein
VGDLGAPVVSRSRCADHQGVLMSESINPAAMSPADAAAFLGLSKRQVSRLISSRAIRARRAGPRTLVETASLREYLESLPLVTGPRPAVPK